MPEAWTLQLVLRGGVALTVTLLLTVLAMGNLIAATALGGQVLAMVAAFAYLAACWMAIVAPVEEAVDGLTGGLVPDPAIRVRRLGVAFLTSLPLAWLQVSLMSLAIYLADTAARSLFPYTDIHALASIPILLWFHGATILTLVRRRLRPDEPWLYSLLAGHGQVLRFLPMGLVDVARDWSRRRDLQLGSYPGVPGQGMVHSRLGIAWAVDIGIVAAAISAGAAVAHFLGGGELALMAVVVVASGVLALGAYLGGMNLAHAYAGYLSYAGGHLDAWLEAGATRPELPAGTGAPPPDPADDPSPAGGSAAG